MSDSGASLNLSQGPAFFRALIRGDFGLAKTYWLYGVAAGYAFNGLMSVVTSRTMLAGIIFVYVAYSIPVLIGIWRAANRYQGPRVWPVLAKVGTVVGCLLVGMVGVLGMAFAMESL